MSKLWPITIFSILMAVLSHQRSGYDPIHCRYRQKERIFYTIMTIGLIVFAGLRIYYNDTTTYFTMYNQIAKNPDWYETIRWNEIGDNPGFVFIQGILTELNISQQTFVLLFSAFTVGTNLWFFRKYSCNLWLSVLLYITFAGFLFSMAAIKQTAAMALGLIATDRAINKKYVSFVVYVVLGTLLHPYALMYLVIPFLFFRPWSKNTLIMLIVFACVGVGLESLLGTLLNITDMIGETYDYESFTRAGVNPFRLLVTAVPMILSVLTMEQIAEREEKDQYLILNLTMLNTEIMFVALFGTANYFARLANYFLPFQALSIPWLLKQFDYRGRRTMTMIASGCFILYFIYAYAITERFDAIFYRITFWEYLSDVFAKGVS